MIKLENVKSPFMCYCAKVIPLAFDESMSYYECLCNFYNYLKNEIMPAINNNAEATKELQEKFIELTEYVDHYFDTLDLQEEVNNKLDDMAESGELAEIIAQYVELQNIKVYDTVDDLKNAENLVNGNFAQTMGYYEINDNGGATYLIRTITNEDVIDNKKIIGIVNDVTLVAELLYDKINVKAWGVVGDGETDDTDAINYCLNNVSQNANIVYFPDGIYLIDGIAREYVDGLWNLTGKGLIVKSNTKIEMAKNCVIKQTGGTDYPSSVIFNLYNIDNVEISGGKIKGDSDTHDMTRVESLQSTDEWGFGIFIRTCRNIKIHDVEIYNCMGDGVCIGLPNIDSDIYPEDYHNYNINLYNLYIHDLRRNGIAYTDGYYWSITNCRFKNINGTDPRAAIDVEGEGDLDFEVKYGNIDNIFIDDCFRGIDNLHGSYYNISNVHYNCTQANSIAISTNDTNNVNITNVNSNNRVIINGNDLNLTNVKGYDLIFEKGINHSFISCEFEHFHQSQLSVSDKHKCKFINSNITYLHMDVSGDYDIDNCLLGSEDSTFTDTPIYTNLTGKEINITVNNSKILTMGSYIANVANGTGKLIIKNSFINGKIFTGNITKLELNNNYFNRLSGGVNIQTYAIHCNILNNVFSTYGLTSDYSSAMALTSGYINVVNNVFENNNTYTLDVGVYVAQGDVPISKCCVTNNCFNNCTTTTLDIHDTTNVSNAINFN